MSAKVHEGPLNSTAREDAFNWLKRFGVRWFTLYLLLYVLGCSIFQILANANIPGMSWLNNVVLSVWIMLVQRIGERLVGHSIAVRPGDDYLFTYIQVGIIFILTFSCAIVWTLLERDHKRERLLYEVTRFPVRYCLAAVMFSYGFLKVFNTQFPHLGPIHLMEPVGDLTPAGLMWTFMGYSALYTVFGGLAEVIGGILVLFRRTTALGALITAAVMINVLLMDVSYDVLVRILAANLVLMALFLLIPDLQRIMNAILAYRPSPTIPLNRIWIKTWTQAAATALKIAIVAILLLQPMITALKYAKASTAAQNMPMNGLYHVKDFRGSSKLQRGFGTGEIWERVAIEGENDWSGTLAYLMAVRTESDAIQYFALRISPVNLTHGQFKLIQCAGTGVCSGDLPANSLHMTLEYRIQYRSDKKTVTGPKPDELWLRGSIRGVPISMHLQRIDPNTFLLVRTPIYFVTPDNGGFNI